MARHATVRWPRARAAATLTGHVARCMPWAALLAGCLTGICVTAVLAKFAGTLQQPAAVVTGTRAGFVPVMAAVAFLLHDPHSQLTGALPARPWLTSAVRLAVALPVIAGTVCAELWLASLALHTYLRRHGPPAAPLSAAPLSRPLSWAPLSWPPLPWAWLALELAAGCAVALAAAALVARCRLQDFGGALALPCTLAAIAAVAVLPPLALPLLALHPLPTAFLDMSAAQRQAWPAAGWLWAGVTGGAATLACWAVRDPWLRLGHRWPRPYRPW